MRVVSYRREDGQGYGLLEGEMVLAASPALKKDYPTLRTLLAGPGLPALADDCASRDSSFELDSVTLLPPFPDAGKIICVGINYTKIHPVEGVALPPPEHIILFAKWPQCLVGQGQALRLPPGEAAASFDYEGELVMVIGKEGRAISKAQAMDHVAGYTIMNDGSVRDWQKQSLQAGKSFEASGACGPWMVSAEAVGDPSKLALSTRLNGEEVQSTTVAEMIFDLPTIIEYVSSFITLQPGDMISTGSPEGSGASRRPQRFLRAGDELEIEWDGIGCLRNRVEA